MENKPVPGLKPVTLKKRRSIISVIQVIYNILIPKKVPNVYDKNIENTYVTNRNSKKVQNANIRKTDSPINFCNGM